jgi:tetratricopeptide (TPR) repeat protein
LQFSFQDIVLLRTAQGLLKSERNPRRVWRAMRTLGKQLQGGRPLSAVKMRLQGSDVLVSASNTTWNPESGQTLFDFSRQRTPASSADSVARLERRSTARVAQVAKTADDWFELGIALERVGATLDAEAAYRSAFEIDRDHVDSRINLGRLRHAAQALDEAESLYGQAIALNPTHAVAHFNLGVVLEDRGAMQEAMAMYKSALECDPQVAEAHFNLARLYEHCGDQRAALRHLSSFKRLKDGA